MEDYKEFTGKSLDEAMAAACSYFGLERGKLEIEILSDAKSGIFGLVGAKKATVRARKANLEALNLKVGEGRQDKKPQSKNEKPRQEKPAKAAPAKAEPVKAAPRKEEAPKPEPPKAEAAPEAPPAQEARAEKPAQKQSRERARPDKRQEKRPEGLPESRAENRSEARPEKLPENRAEARPDSRGDKRPGDKQRGRGKAERQRRERKPRPEKPAPQHDILEEKFPELDLASMDQALLEAEVLNAVDAMTRHIVGETGKEFEVSGGKARVRIDSGEDSGLLIGRDGQTLSALQYLASCIVSRRLNASVRVQIDAGDYRSRQLEKLRETALELAAKVKETARPQSTRPMSAYLRRVVHMALQEDPDVQTHSKGEGSLKRVVIVPRKK